MSYIPKHFEERDIGVLHALIQSHPLGAWVVHADGELVVNHVPCLLDPTRGDSGTLACHVARANPVWKSLRDDAPCVVIFQGPEAYITPSWYPSKQAHGKAVPTWNFAVVHAHGVARAIEDQDWLRNHVTELTDRNEAGSAAPWSVSDAPPDYVDSLLKAIVGIEIPITALVGKWKTSQNRPLADKLGIIAGLHQRGDDGSKAMADLVARQTKLTIRDVRPDEFDALGRLLVEVYGGLPGFPTPAEQPAYYEMLANIGRFTEKPAARVLVAVLPTGELVGGIVYFGDMAAYGSGGIATAIQNASGIRLLGVDPAFRGLGAGKQLTEACVRLARDKGHSQVILHTTKAMQTAWGLYERLGFVRSDDLDFLQQGFPVYGFRLLL